MRSRTAFAILNLLAVAAAASAQDAAPPAGTPVPGRADLVAPPRIAAGPGGTLLVALASADGIDVVTSTGAGKERRFAEPVRAVRRGGLMAGGRRGPRIAVSGTRVLLAAITRREKDGGGDLLAWRSSDGGATWGEAALVSDVPGCAEEGLFDVAALGDGRFVVVWLDHRTIDGKARGMRVRCDFSDAGATTWGEDVLAYESPGGSVCECCAPAITASADGGAVLGFRNAVKGDRDVWTARLPRGGVRFDAARKSGRGRWTIAACPMAGPAVAVSGSDVVSAWRRENDVFVATGDAKERELGAGTEPQVVVREDGVHVVWISNGALVHLAPAAKSPATVAAGAAMPHAVSPADPKAPGVVAWFDAALRRARIAEIR